VETAIQKQIQIFQPNLAQREALQSFNKLKINKGVIVLPTGVGKTMFDAKPEKFEVLCPECGTKNEVLYFPKKFISFKAGGTAGISGTKVTTNQQEKIIGNCKECKYKFKSEDL